MKEHTPGPWRINVSGSEVGVNYSFLARKKNGWVNILKGNSKHDGITRATCAEAAANARLIASAPDMLAALVMAERKLSAYVGVCGGDKELTDEVLPLCRAAVAKAQGEA